jgi:hypothetical protein
MRQYLFEWLELFGPTHGRSPWSQWQPRHLHRKPVTHAGMAVKLPPLYSCYLCAAVYVVAVR